MKKIVLLFGIILNLIFSVNISFANNNWSEWQDEAISSSDTIEVETRQVPSSYIMVSFVCGVSGYPRGYYSWNKGSFRCDYSFEWTASEFDNAIVYHEGDYFDFYDGTACDGLIGGGGNAYVKDSDWYIPCYVRETKYKTQYRYREIQKEVANSNNSSADIENHKSQTTQPTTKAKTREKTYETSKSSIKEREDIVKENKKSKGKNMNGGAKIWNGTSDSQNQTSENIANTIETTQENQNKNKIQNNQNIADENGSCLDSIKKIEAVNFANSYVGQKISFDNNNSLDCVDIAKRYFYDIADFPNVTIGNEGAKNYSRYDYIIPSGWSRLYYPNYTPQSGDVAVWDNNWNHVAVVVGGIDYEGKITVVDQDSVLQRAAESNRYLVSNVTCFLVPPFNLSLTGRVGYSFDGNNNPIYNELTSLVANRKIKLYSKETNKCVFDENGTQHADADFNSMEACVFDVVLAADGWVGFKKNNGKYLSAQNQGYISAEGDNLSSWECFKVFDYGQDVFLLNQKEYKYVQVINDGIQITNPLQAARNYSDGLSGAYWERFEIYFVDGK